MMIINSKGQTSIAYLLGFMFLMLVVALIIISLRRDFFYNTNITLNQNSNSIHNLECFSKTYQTSPQNVVTFFQFLTDPKISIIDSSKNQTNSQVNGKIEYLNNSNCLFGGCLYLTGNGQNIALSNIKINSSVGTFTTVEFYMDWKGFESEYPFTFDNNYGLYLNKGCFGFTTGKSDIYGINSSILINNPVLVDAIFYNSNDSNFNNPIQNNLNLFLNGTKQSLVQCSGEISNAQVSTNATYGSSMFAENFFNGILGPIVIYNRELTSSEISDDFYCKLP